MGFANKANRNHRDTLCGLELGPYISNGAPKSGRVCGRFDKNEANNCYANPNMECRFSANTPAIVDEVDSKLFGTLLNGADRYNGLSTMTYSDGMQSRLFQWDESIWDLAGEKPRFGLGCWLNEMVCR